MNWHVFSTIVLVLHWIIVIGLSIRVIMRRRPVGVSLAWLTVIVAVPVVGVVFYLLFGEQRLGRKRRERIGALLGNAQTLAEDASRMRECNASRARSVGASLDRHATKVVGFPPLAGNRIELLDNFQSVFDSLIRDIDAAQRSCWTEFYIWHAGGRADDVVDALVRAAGRGVTCRVNADDIGSREFLKGPLTAKLRDAGVDVTISLPTGLVRSIFVRGDLRNHRKIVVIDDRIGYTGSQNLVDPRYFKQDAGVGEWVDAMARIEGPAVSPMAATFLADCCVETGQPFDTTLLPGPPFVSPGAESPGAEFTGTATVQVVPSGPGGFPEVIRQLILTTMYSARRELILTTPYFVPDETVLTAIVSTALRGVDVTLIVPAKNDSMMVRYASVAHFDDLLAAGVRVARFHGGLLHTKSATVDGQMSLFGSVNLDMRSLYLNSEISLLVYDADFTSRLRALQQTYIDRSDFVDLKEWRQRGAGQALAENTFRLLSPLL